MLHFTKMHGLGNDFVVIDAIHQNIQLSPAQIQFMADRHFGIGFDQLLLVEKPVSANADFKYRIFNADGSEVSQCGNGARCFARFVRDKKLSDKAEIRVDTNAGQLVLCFNDSDLITVNMGVPRFEHADIPFLAEEYATLENDIYKIDLFGSNHKKWTIPFNVVSMGNPHAVIQVPQNSPITPLTKLFYFPDLEEIGKQLEHHPMFPERANIGFMQRINRDEIKLRVYERGAGETLACGSGACAAVVVGIEQGLLNNSVRVTLKGGDLNITWAGRGQPVFMTGSAVSVFEGFILL